MKFVEFEHHILDITTEHHPGIFISVENLLSHTRAIIHEQAVVKTNHSIAVSIALISYFHHAILLENSYSGYEVSLKYCCFYNILNIFNTGLIITHPQLNMRSQSFSVVLDTFWDGFYVGHFNPQTNQGRSHFLSLLRQLNEKLLQSKCRHNSLWTITFVAVLVMMSIELINTLSVDLGACGVVVLLSLFNKLIDLARGVSLYINEEGVEPLIAFL
jgi:hypothetical protein